MNEFTYYAFISYKREDEKWARWLQTKLESYKLPSILQKQYNLNERRIKPVFRDKTDLSIGTVKGALTKELMASKYLIVICSPRSANSEWVDLEVLHFIEAGNTDHIIPFIIDGTPNSTDPLTECFPPSMRALDNQLLGINIHEVGKSIAFYRVVAGLLEIHADAVIKREKRIKRKKAILLSILSLCMLTIGFLLFWYYKPETKYYSDYVINQDIPEGIYPLSPQEIKHRGCCYKFTYQIGYLKKIVHINSAGKPIPEENPELMERPSTMKLFYDEYGGLQRIKYFDEFGRRLMNAVYGNYTSEYHKVIEFEQEDGNDDNYPYLLFTDCTSVGGLFGLYYERYRNIPYQKSSISEFELLHDKDDIVTGIKFLNRFGMKACDMNGIYQINYRFDELGRVVKLSYCDISGMPIANKQGIAGKEYTYQGSDMIKITWLDRNDTPINNLYGYAICERQFDNNGNCISEQYLDRNGTAIANLYGYTSIKYTYDLNGYRITAKTYDSAGNSVITPDGFAGVYYQYDKLGNLVQLKYAGVNDEPCKNKQGVYGVEYVYDDENKQIEERYIDAENNPMQNMEGIACKKKVLFENIEFYDINGQLVCNSEGYAKVNYDLDVSNLENECRIKRFTICRDQNDNMINSTYGFAYISRGYDKYDRLLYESFFNTNDEPVKGPSGYKSIRYTYDLLDNMTKLEFYDDNHLANGPEGYAQKVSTFSSTNQLISESYFNESGQFVTGPNHYAQFRIDYNSNGNEIEQRFLDENGSPVLGPEGFASKATEYSVDRSEINVTFLGADGKTRNTVYGYAHAKSKKINQEGDYQTWFYDAEGKDITIN